MKRYQPIYAGKLPKRRHWFWLTSLLFLLFLGLLSFFTWQNKQEVAAYKIVGVHTSAENGQISWGQLDKKIQFMYIKATEGSSYVDDRFEYNWSRGQGVQLPIGVWHFFSFDSSGDAQAQHFLKKVTAKQTQEFPPMILLEYYDDKANDPPKKEYVVKNLKQFLHTVEPRTQKKWVIMATPELYEKYLINDFPNQPIGIISKHEPSQKIPWLFWQKTTGSHVEISEINSEYMYYNGDNQEFIELQH